LGTTNCANANVICANVIISFCQFASQCNYDGEPNPPEFPMTFCPWFLDSHAFFVRDFCV
jgi:hypothetical protein